MVPLNFWLMDFLTSSLIFVSALYGEKSRRQALSLKSDDIESKQTGEQLEERKITTYLFLNFAYFLVMGLTVVLLQYYPSVMIILQHVAVVIFILIAFARWISAPVGYPLGCVFSVLWILSGDTEFRWILNNIIIAMFTLLASHVQFRNFPFLQIFMWTAFVYDVCLLARMTNGPQLFSVNGDCFSLLCQLFEINNTWELPAVFTVRIGESYTHVFLGTGDIIIGAISTNFAMSFFRSSKCVFMVVCGYSLSIALLSHVGSKPYPALVSIVPCCTLALILCAIVCRKTKKLFSLASNQDCIVKEEDFILI